MKKIILILIFASAILKAEEDFFMMIYPVDPTEIFQTQDSKDNLISIVQYIYNNYNKEQIKDYLEKKYSHVFVKKILKDKEIDILDLISSDYKFLNGNAIYNHDYCMLYADLNESDICFYSIAKDKIIHKIDYEVIREFYGSDKYVAAFNKDYEFEFYDINTAEKQLTLKPDSIITGDNLLLDKYFVMNHAGGITIYDLETGKYVMQYETSNIEGNKLIQKDDSSFYFIDTKKLFLIDAKNQQVKFDLELASLGANRIYLNAKKMQFVYTLNDSTIVFDGAFSGEYISYNLENATKYNVFVKDEEGLVISKHNKIFKLRYNRQDESDLIFLKNIDEIKKSRKTESFKEPGVDLSKLQGNIVYPRLARMAGIEGFIVLKALISKDGLPVSITIGHPDSKHIFFQSAAQAILETEIVPSYENGKPTKCHISIPVNYKLK